MPKYRAIARRRESLNVYVMGVCFVDPTCSQPSRPCRPPWDGLSIGVVLTSVNTLNLYTSADSIPRNLCKYRRYKCLCTLQNA